ncbi:hypothetical protein DFJ74DRAFT_693123 [Hyaloraphidium curvatum]|nr:hypothetical protein DFJ74DRAFT_693123 [Hyaloraphidium curvatum]
MARARLRPAGFEIMDAAEISMPRGAAHRQGGDCSHYCLPGVPDAWAGVLLRMVWDRCGEGTAPD